MKTKIPTSSNFLKEDKYKILFDEKEKFANEKEAVKELVKYYEQIGLTHVFNQEEKIRRLYRLANGQIDVQDYVGEVDIKNAMDISMEEMEEVELQFYPIIPNIVNVFLGEVDKKYIKYLPHAVNSEAKNEILDKLNKDIIDVIVKKAQNVFEQSIEGDPPDIQKQKREAFEQSEQIQKFYKTDYRLEIEQWANHNMNIEDEKFNMKEIERKVLEQILVTDSPFVHTALIDDYYYPEVLEEKNCFYLKSPNIKDVSDAVMFGWFDYLNFNTILNKFGHMLSEKDVEKLENWHYKLNRGFVNNNSKKFTEGNKTDLQESYTNWLGFKQIEGTHYQKRYEEPYQTLVKQTFIYFLVPKKEGLLTVKTDNETYSNVVDESFKVTIKPIYTKGKPRIKENLEYGEHVDWGWKNELWKAIKLDINHSNAYTNLSESDDTSSIWVYLNPNEIQPRAKNFRYGVRIPVNGGPSTNRYSEITSVVSKLATWQIDYNFLWNRIKQLLSSEVGKFLIINQSILPNESLDGSWGKNNFVKALEVGRDMSLMPVDPSLTNTGQAGAAAQGFGQVVDLSKTGDILEKIKVAETIKAQAYEQIGVTPQTLGDISPYQSTNTVMQGLQRSATQVQYIYTRLSEVMKLHRETMLETALYLASRNDLIEFNYLNSDQQREIFRSNTTGWMLYELGIYVRNSIQDTETVEKLQQLAIQNNTSGADISDLASIIGSSSKIEIINKLKQFKEDRQRMEEQKMKHEQELKDKELQAAEKRQQMLFDHENQNKELDRQADKEESMLKALGYANDSAAEINNQMMRLKESLDKQKEFSSKMDLNYKMEEFKARTSEADSINKRLEIESAERIKAKEVAIREMEAENRRLALVKGLTKQ